MDLDQGGRHLAGLVLDAAGRGHHDQVADLIAPLDVDQLRYRLRRGRALRPQRRDRTVGQPLTTK